MTPGPDLTAPAEGTAPAEATEIHTRLMKCALEAEDARAYWAHPAVDGPVPAQRAFDEYWFGAKSLARVTVLLRNFRTRFDAYPAAAATLRRWPHMDPETRRLICHWHVQLADPVYRAFTGDYLVERRLAGRADVTRDLVIAWVADQGPGRWTTSTHVQFASKLMSTALSAGLLGGNRDPRPLTLPRVPDAALAYLMYLLREVTFEGSLLANPYTASVGLDGRALEDRLGSVPGLSLRRQGDLIDMGWQLPDLTAWAAAMFGPDPVPDDPAAPAPDPRHHPEAAP